MLTTILKNLNDLSEDLEATPKIKTKVIRIIKKLEKHIDKQKKDAIIKI